MANTQTTLNILVQMNIASAKKQLMQLKNLTQGVSKTKNVDTQQIKQQRMINELQKNVVTDAKRLNKVKQDTYSFEGMKNEQNRLNEMGIMLGKQSKEYKAQQKVVNRLGKELKYNTNQMARMHHRTKKFNFDFLSLLFAGMMMQRVFGGMFKSITNNYKKITGMNSQFNKSIMKAQASFSYLKFAIASALESPGVMKAIEWFTGALEWLGDWASEHPGWSLLFLGIIGVLTALGTFAMIASGVIQMAIMFDIFAMWGSSISKLFNVKSLIALKARILTLKTAMINFKTWVTTNWKGIAIAGLNIAGMVLSVSDLIKNIKKNDWAGVIGDAIATGLYVAGAIASIFSGPAGLILFMAGTAVLAITKLTAKTRDKMNVLEELGLAEKDGALKDLDVGLAYGAGVTGKKRMDEYRAAQIKGLQIIEERYEIAFNKINKLQKDLTENSINYTLNEKIIKSEAIAGWASTIERLTQQGMTLNNSEFMNFIDLLNARNDAITLDAQDQKTIIDSKKAKQDELNQKIQEYSNKLSDASLIDLFKGLDLVKFDEFKVILEDIKIPIANLTMLLSGEGGLYLSLYSIQQLFEISLLTNMKDFNQYINNSIAAIPLHVTALGNEELAMKNLAKETNSAAAAQERLNKARIKKGTKIDVFGQTVYQSSYSTSTKTT